MSRYLQRSFLESAINRGRSLEQLLPAGEFEGNATVRWLELAPKGPATIELRLFEALDVGGPTYLDVYSFPPVSDDQDLLREAHAFSSLEDALSVARQLYDAESDRFVNCGVIQDEYADSLVSRSWPPAPDPAEPNATWRLTRRCSGPHPGVRPGAAAELHIR
jgi:hypothetical protein